MLPRLLSKLSDNHRLLHGDMKLYQRIIRNTFICISLFFISLVLSSCGLLQERDFEETFDSPGNWGSGHSSEVDGQVSNGVYELYVKSNHGLYFASAGEKFADGIYELEATQIEGPLNNGYGMLFRLDEASDSFYAFEISGDGYVWIGYCSSLCEEQAIALVGGDWFPSSAVNTGLHARNHLRVRADGPMMTFFVNGVQVGRTSDSRLVDGDVAVMVEALGEGKIRVAFDNFKYSPQ